MLPVFALTATLLAGCVTFRPAQEAAFPAVPADLRACFSRAFPEIPDRDLLTRDVVRIIGEAKALDEVKTLCGERAIIWMEEVSKGYGPRPDDEVAFAVREHDVGTGKGTDAAVGGSVF